MSFTKLQRQVLEEIILKARESEDGEYRVVGIPFQKRTLEALVMKGYVIWNEAPGYVNVFEPTEEGLKKYSRIAR